LLPRWILAKALLYILVGWLPLLSEAMVVHCEKSSRNNLKWTHDLKHGKELEEDPNDLS
jgi:hypothetical protein